MYAPPPPLHAGVQAARQRLAARLAARVGLVSALEVIIGDLATGAGAHALLGAGPTGSRVAHTVTGVVATGQALAAHLGTLEDAVLAGQLALLRTTSAPEHPHLQAEQGRVNG